MPIHLGSLIATKPARFPEQAAQEERTYSAILRLWGRIEAFLFNALGLRDPGTHAAEEVPWVMGPTEEFRLLQAAQWLCEGTIGNAQSASEFAAPTYALVSVENPVWEGKPILPGELRTAYSIGITRAVRESGIAEAALVGTKQIMAQEELSRIAFDRLTQGARDKIGHVLYKPGYPGGVRDALQDAMARGENPLKVARELRDRFDGIRDYNWARLARTEISFAQNGAMIAEYTQEGYRRAPGGLLPTYHPLCVCSTTILPQKGWIVPDVAATACEVCQRHLAEYMSIVLGTEVKPKEPVLPPVQRVAAGPKDRKRKTPPLKPTPERPTPKTEPPAPRPWAPAKTIEEAKAWAAERNVTFQQTLPVGEVEKNLRDWGVELSGEFSLDELNTFNRAFAQSEQALRPELMANLTRKPMVVSRVHSEGATGMCGTGREATWMGIDPPSCAAARKKARQGDFIDLSDEGTIRHEIGHAIANTNPRVMRESGFAGSGVKISTYAATNESEGFAEFVCKITKPKPRIRTMKPSAQAIARKLLREGVE